MAFLGNRKWTGATARREEWNGIGSYRSGGQIMLSLVGSPEEGVGSGQIGPWTVETTESGNQMA